MQSKMILALVVVAQFRDALVVALALAPTGLAVRAHNYSYLDYSGISVFAMGLVLFACSWVYDLQSNTPTICRSWAFVSFFHNQKCSSPTMAPP